MDYSVNHGEQFMGHFLSHHFFSDPQPPPALTQTDQAHKLPVLSAGRKVFHVPDSCNKNMPVCLVTVCARGGGSKVGAGAGCSCVGMGAQEIVLNWGILCAWDRMGAARWCRHVCYNCTCVL